MRSLYCMTAAVVLAAGVSARADMVGTFNVSGMFNSVRVSDSVVIDATNRLSESVGTFSLPMDAAEQGNLGSSIDFVCSLADFCDGSFGTEDANAVSAAGLQSEGATRGAEPSSVALLGTGLLGFAAVMRRRFVA